MGKSQYGETGFLYRYFNEKENGILIDVGASDGVKCSNSFDLIHDKNWKAILIEPNKNAFDKLVKLYINNPKVYCELAACGSIMSKEVLYIDDYDESQQLSTILEEQKINCENYFGCKFSQQEIMQYPTSYFIEKHGLSKIDFMSIDTEGNDFQVIKGIDFDKVDIDLFCIEHIHNALISYLSKKGYREIYRTIVHGVTGNVFFSNR